MRINSFDIYGNTARYRQKSKTIYQGGYTLHKPWANFETKLVDVSNGRTAWVATSFTGGNAYANKNTLINSYCGKTVDQLLENNLILEIKTK